MDAVQPAMRLCLEELLQTRQISRYQLAKDTGITYQTIDNYYKNKVSRYDADILLKICLALECDIGELLKISP